MQEKRLKQINLIISLQTCASYSKLPSSLSPAAINLRAPFPVGKDSELKKERNKHKLALFGAKQLPNNEITKITIRQTDIMIKYEPKQKNKFGML